MATGYSHTFTPAIRSRIPDGWYPMHMDMTAYLDGYAPAFATMKFCYTPTGMEVEIRVDQPGEEAAESIISTLTALTAVAKEGAPLLGLDVGYSREYHP